MIYAHGGYVHLSWLRFRTAWLTNVSRHNDGPSMIWIYACGFHSTELEKQSRTRMLEHVSVFKNGFIKLPGIKSVDRSSQLPFPMFFSNTHYGSEKAFQLSQSSPHHTASGTASSTFLTDTTSPFDLTPLSQCTSCVENQDDGASQRLRTLWVFQHQKANEGLQYAKPHVFT